MSAPASRPSTDGILLTHTTLIALTPLIPLPFVDDWVRGWLLRRMARGLAEAHRLRIWPEEIRVLVELPSSSWVGGMVKGAILSPIKKVLRKTFMFLAGKRIVDIASETYHRGYLIDLAFARGWCEPHGDCSAKELRSAIDAVLKEVPVSQSPVTTALRAGFEEAQSTLADVYTSLRARIGGVPTEATVARAIDDAEAAGLGGVVASLRRALLEVPREHFEALERALAQRVLPDGIPLGTSDELVERK